MASESEKMSRFSQYSRLNNGFARYPALIPEIFLTLPYVGKATCTCDQDKDLEMRKLSWFTWRGPDCNHTCPSKRGSGRFDHRKGGESIMTEAETGLRSSEDGGRGHEPRTRGGPWELERQGNEFLEPPQAASPARTLALAQWK